MGTVKLGDFSACAWSRTCWRPAAKERASVPPTELFQVAVVCAISRHGCTAKIGLLILIAAP